MYPEATSVFLRKLCFAATLAWTPWWLVEPSDLAAHTLVHTPGIGDKGPFSLLNPVFLPSLSPALPPPNNICFNCLPQSLTLFFNSFLSCSSSHTWPPPTTTTTPSPFRLATECTQGFCVQSGSLLSVPLADNLCLVVIAPPHQAH